MVTVPAVVADEAEPAVVAYVAFATIPVTLAPATAFAVAAYDTSPDTFAPATAFAVVA